MYKKYDLRSFQIEMIQNSKQLYNIGNKSSIDLGLDKKIPTSTQTGADQWG